MPQRRPPHAADTMTTNATSSARAKKRDSERRARARRRAKLEHMRLTNDALECAVVVARTLGDELCVWSDFLDEKTTRFRYFLLQALQLTNEATRLRLEQAHLRQLLHEQRVYVEAIEALYKDRPSHDWEAIGKCWRQLTREHFRSWSRLQCEEEMEAALKDVNAFRWSTTKHTTGVSLNGWRDARRVDPIRRVVQFEFSKTFQGNVMDFVNMLWDAYTDAQSFQDVIGGHRMLVHHEILQQIGPNIVIFRLAERFPHIVGDVHIVYFVCRVRTERGVLQCVRSVWDPKLMQAISGPNDMVAVDNFIWFQCDRLLEESGYVVRIGGTMGGVDVSYANRWMMEVFAAVVRGEQRATGRRFVLAPVG